MQLLKNIVELSTKKDKKFLLKSKNSIYEFQKVFSPLTTPSPMLKPHKPKNELRDVYLKKGG